MNEPTETRDEASPLVWRRSDQAVIAVVVAFALVALAAWAWSNGGADGRLVELDQQTPTQPAFILDINTAGIAEISQLPGVGAGLARSIVESREAEGPFRSVDELDRVKGIGAKTLEKIRPHLSVGNPVTDDTGKVSAPKTEN